MTSHRHLPLSFALIGQCILKHHPLATVSQVAYFLSWPTLGSAIILVMMPSEDKMRQVHHLPLQTLLSLFAALTPLKHVCHPS